MTQPLTVFQYKLLNTLGGILADDVVVNPPAAVLPTITFSSLTSSSTPSTASTKLINTASSSDDQARRIAITVELGAAAGLGLGSAVGKSSSSSSSVVDIAVKSDEKIEKEKERQKEREDSRRKDDVMKQAYDILGGDQLKLLDSAAEIIDSQTSTARIQSFHSASLPNRRFWVVPGSRGNSYLCLKYHCPCRSFYEQAKMQYDHQVAMCKHMLAIRLLEAMEQIDVRIVSDAQYIEAMSRNEAGQPQYQNLPQQNQQQYQQQQYPPPSMPMAASFVPPPGGGYPR